MRWEVRFHSIAVIPCMCVLVCLSAADMLRIEEGLAAARAEEKRLVAALSELGVRPASMEGRPGLLAAMLRLRG
jgi:hypothetical protein